MKDYYTEIDKALKAYENHSFVKTKDIHGICDKIEWCLKWKKLSDEQIGELIDRACTILNGDDCFEDAS